MEKLAIGLQRLEPKPERGRGGIDRTKIINPGGS